ncbi:uncharacterized protein LOC111693662 [Trichogramma pretiosum]|uniref:uncharacterized protein LOC111693662 n=1 Tax=Trichogramma pretiosum TaxID=7493 RepID=UPI000C71B0CC|nr:uncharacterized protein LOC111693662 [Trichogramma pretiosum]
MLMGQQSGFTKYPCFKCLWDSRDRKNHYTDHKWTERNSLEAGHHNVINSPLVDPKKVLLPPLHIKLGIMKQFVKALSESDESVAAAIYSASVELNVTNFGHRDDQVTVS